MTNDSMKPVVIKADHDGRIMITAEEIKKNISDAYDQGYQDGKGSVMVTYEMQST